MMKNENKLDLTKYLTVITLITILITSPLTVPIAFADNNNEDRGGKSDKNSNDEDRGGKSDKNSNDNSKPAPIEPTSVTAYINGYVTDLGVQKYTLNGKSSPAALIGDTILVNPKTSLILKATVIDDVVTGSLKLTVEGKSENDKIELTVDIPINRGSPGLGCIDGTETLVECPSKDTWTPSDNLLPFLELPNGDFIPMVFFGVGDVTLNVGKETTIYQVNIVIDTSTAQHPFKGGPSLNTGQVFIADENGLFALDVDVTKFDVTYTGVKMEGIVSGALEGDMIQIANSNEDHVNNVQQDKGDIVFSVIYNETEITMTGSYTGDSNQNPNNEYLYISTGTFKTSDDLKIKGTYDTFWVLPLFFSSTFEGIVNN